MFKTNNFWLHTENNFSARSTKKKKMLKNNKPVTENCVLHTEKYDNLTNQQQCFVAQQNYTVVLTQFHC